MHKLRKATKLRKKGFFCSWKKNLKKSDYQARGGGGKALVAFLCASLRKIQSKSFTKCCMVEVLYVQEVLIKSLLIHTLEIGDEISPV